MEPAILLLRRRRAAKDSAATAIAPRPNSGTPVVVGTQKLRLTIPVAVAAAERVILVEVTEVTVVPAAIPGPDTVMPEVIPEKLAAVIVTEPRTVATPVTLTHEGWAKTGSGLNAKNSRTPRITVGAFLIEVWSTLRYLILENPRIMQVNLILAGLC